MMKHWRGLVMIWLMFGQAPRLAYSQQEFIPPMPEDFDKVDFSLITVGYGYGIHTAFGHTIVRVEDHGARTDMVFNWGVFDFNDPWFLFNFAYGRLNYRMAVNSIGTTFRIYQYEQRSVVQNKLNLTNAQKRRLMEKIIWQSQPENLYYAYHYYFDNCSTRVRDYLDLALNGAFSGRFRKAEAFPQSLTLRESIQNHFRHFPMTGMATDIVMNSDLDDKMNAWEEMYLPAALQKYLKAMPQIDDEGAQVPGSQLLGPDSVLLKFQDPEPAPFSGYHLMVFLFGIPLLIGGNLLWRFGRFRLIGMRIFALGAVGWGIIAGFFSLAMIWYWAVSVHTHGFHNANLWLLWPTDLLWAWYGAKWFWKGQTLSLDNLIRRLLAWSSWGHIVCIPVFLLLFISGILKQDVSNPLLYLAPLTLICSWITVRWGFTKEPMSRNEPSGIA